MSPEEELSHALTATTVRLALTLEDQVVCVGPLDPFSQGFLMQHSEMRSVITDCLSKRLGDLADAQRMRSMAAEIQSALSARWRTYEGTGRWGARESRFTFDVKAYRFVAVRRTEELRPL